MIQISPIEEVGARIGMAFVFMSTGALAGTPIGGVFISSKTLPNFRHLILFSVRLISRCLAARIILIQVFDIGSHGNSRLRVLLRRAPHSVEDAVGGYIAIYTRPRAVIKIEVAVL